MGQRQIPSLAGIVQSDTAATGTALAERDASGDLFAARLRASAGLINAGEEYQAIVAKTTSFTADATMRTVIVDTTAGSVTVTLPAAAGCSGKVLTFVKSIAANSLILDGNAAETINGTATNTTTAQYGKVTIQSDGSNWWIIG